MAPLTLKCCKIFNKEYIKEEFLLKWFNLKNLPCWSIKKIYFINYTIFLDKKYDYTDKVLDLLLKTPSKDDKSKDNKSETKTKNKK